MDANEVKKELYKSKANAKLDGVVSGTMYYTVPLADGVYRFPIETVEKINTPLYKLNTDMATNPSIPAASRDGMLYTKYEGRLFDLSSDLGTTYFGNEMKASDLNRWIAKAIDKGEFVKIS